jgi:hypothetical protein
VCVVGPSREDEMVALFLRGELGSTRFENAVGEALARADADARVVTSPDVSDLRENMLRRRLLTESRGYATSEGVFGGLPTDFVTAGPRGTRSSSSRATFA